MFCEEQLLEVATGKIVQGRSIQSSLYALVFMNDCNICEEATTVVRDLQSFSGIVTVFVPLDSDDVKRAAESGLKYSLRSENDCKKFRLVYRVTYCPSVVVVNHNGEIIDKQADVTLMVKGAEKAMISWISAESPGGDVCPPYITEADITSDLAHDVMMNMSIAEGQSRDDEDVKPFPIFSDNPVEHWGIPPLKLQDQEPILSAPENLIAASNSVTSRIKMEVMSPPARRGRFDDEEDDYKPQFLQL